MSDNVKREMREREKNVSNEFLDENLEFIARQDFS